MVAVVAALVVIDGGFQQLYVIGRLVLNAPGHVFWDLGIWPLALDALTLHAHAAVDVVHLAICAFFVAHQEQRHRDEVERLHIVARLHHHAGSADRQIQQELAHGDVEVGLVQHGEHLVLVDLEHGLRLLPALHWDVRASLQLGPLALWREHNRLQPVGKALGGVDGGRVEDALHLLGPGRATFPHAVELALGQGKFVGILVELLEFVLLGLRGHLSFEDLLWCQAHAAGCVLVVFHDQSFCNSYFSNMLRPLAASLDAAPAVRGGDSPHALAASANRVGSPSSSTSGPLGLV